jgi:hypothetical protein
MSHVAHPIAPTQLRSHLVAALAALAALIAAGAVVLVLTIDGGSTAPQPQSFAQGANESHIAAAVGNRVTPPPDESRIASSVASGTPAQVAGPDESRIASSIAGGTPKQSAGPDESSIASSLSSR